MTPKSGAGAGEVVDLHEDEGLREVPELRAAEGDARLEIQPNAPRLRRRRCWRRRPGHRGWARPRSVWVWGGTCCWSAARARRLELGEGAESRQVAELREDASLEDVEHREVVGRLDAARRRDAAEGEGR